VDKVSHRGRGDSARIDPSPQLSIFRPWSKLGIQLQRAISLALIAVPSTSKKTIDCLCATRTALNAKSVARR
jgi:hypothetical protein